MTLKTIKGKFVQNFSIRCLWADTTDDVMCGGN